MAVARRVALVVLAIKQSRAGANGGLENADKRDKQSKLVVAGIKYHLTPSCADSRTQSVGAVTLLAHHAAVEPDKCERS